MYNDLFSIGPISVHSYGLFTAIGLMAALWLACKRAPKKGLDGDICYGILFCGVIFGYLCSKLTYVLVEFDRFIQNPKMFLSQSGFVVIGGLAGGVLAACIYCRIKKTKFLPYFDLCAPSIAIAQGFGRIGCFMAGCCYGRETDSFIGIAFSHSDFAPNGVKLIPTQLISSAFDFLNMAFLIWLAKKKRKTGFISAVYMLTYSVGRFLVEYLRNDDRGEVGILSTSQFFSIVIFAVGCLYLLWAVKHKEEPALEEGEEAFETKESSTNGEETVESGETAESDEDVAETEDSSETDETEEKSE